MAEETVDKRQIDIGCVSKKHPAANQNHATSNMNVKSKPAKRNVRWNSERRKHSRARKRLIKKKKNRNGKKIQR